MTLPCLVFNESTFALINKSMFCLNNVVFRVDQSLTDIHSRVPHGGKTIKS